MSEALTERRVVVNYAQVARLHRWLSDLCLLLFLAPFWLLGWAWERVTGRSLMD